MSDFKYKVNQEVRIGDGHPKSGVVVRVLSRYNGQWRDKGINTKAYKVSAKAVEPIELYEDQLEIIS